MGSDILTDYQTLIKNIPQLIKISGYRSDFIAKKIGLKSANFSVKKRIGNWSAEEVEKLLQVISNDEAETFLTMELMRNRKDEEEISYEDYKNEISIWK